MEKSRRKISSSCPFQIETLPNERLFASLEPQVKISDKILEESAAARILGCPREKSPRRVLEKRSSQIWSLRVALSQSWSSGERPT